MCIIFLKNEQGRLVLFRFACIGDKVAKHNTTNAKCSHGRELRVGVFFSLAKSSRTDTNEDVSCKGVYSLPQWCPIHAARRLIFIKIKYQFLKSTGIQEVPLITCDVAGNRKKGAHMIPRYSYRSWLLSERDDK
ncbi:hypothetical protein TNCV_4853231 [Trichonephila clavipes]|nr:hypothetical protein TNCV_4853231 [Trichonephila clavipes]